MIETLEQLFRALLALSRHLPPGELADVSEVTVRLADGELWLRTPDRFYSMRRNAEGMERWRDLGDRRELVELLDGETTSTYIEDGPA